MLLRKRNSHTAYSILLTPTYVCLNYSVLIMNDLIRKTIYTMTLTIIS